MLKDFSSLSGLRVLVCGGRDFTDKQKLYNAMDELFKRHSIVTVIQGGARGADSLTAAWARDHGITVEEYPANWDKYGKAAGPIRNIQMLTEAKPDLIVAFPGGKGTTHMKNAAKARGYHVHEIL